MESWFVLLIVAYVVLNAIISIWTLTNVLEEDIKPFPVSAKFMYDNTDMNMFGCIICSGIIMFFTSVYHIPAFIVWTVYKLFHIGRRK